MTIGSKKFKALKEKLFEAGFADKLVKKGQSKGFRMSDANIKLNMTRAAKGLRFEYMKFRQMINKEGRMDKEFYNIINERLNELKNDTTLD